MNEPAKIFRYVTGAIAAVFVCTTIAVAQLPEGDHAKREKDWEAKFNEIVRELNLTPEQKQSMTRQRAQEKTQSQELRQKTRAVREQITQELNKDITDTATVNPLVAQLKELTGQRIEQQIQGIMSLKKILTPEQFKKLNEKRQKDEKNHRRGGKK
jgi:Spy/CpxP family protein refolding chaperone